MKPKYSFILIFASVASAFLHNLIYAIFKFEEPVFFLLALLSALGFVVLGIYNIVIFIKKGKQNINETRKEKI